MPKYTRKQRFAVLKNIFDELGEIGAMRSAARLQVPAEEARDLVAAWKAGRETAVVEDPPQEKDAPRAARPVKAKFSRPPRHVSKPTVRPDRPVTVIKIGEASLPPEKITGDEFVEGFKGAKLLAGSHVRYAPDGTAVGVILKLGKQQSEVKWFRTGAVQAEVNGSLRRK